MRDEEQGHRQVVGCQQGRVSVPADQPDAGQAHAGGHQEEQTQQQGADVGSQRQPLFPMVPDGVGALQGHHRQQDAVHQAVGQAEACELAPRLLAHMGRHLVAAVAVIKGDQPPDGGGADGAVDRFPTPRSGQRGLDLVGGDRIDAMRPRGYGRGRVGGQVLQNKDEK